MSKNSKDKRTNEKTLQLLQSAMEQEERMGLRIQTLENDLAECRKKVEDPGSELVEDALPSSKVSFRIDYYKTDRNGPYKGIIEHLASRERRTFEGDGVRTFSAFVDNYIPQFEKKSKKKTISLDENPVEGIPLVRSSTKTKATGGSYTPSPNKITIEEAKEIFEKARQRTGPVMSSTFASFEVESSITMNQSGEILDVDVIVQERPKQAVSDRIQKILPDLFEPAAESPKPVPKPKTKPLPKVVAGTSPILVIPAGEAAHQGQVSRLKTFQIEVPGADLTLFAGKTCSLSIITENLETGETKGMEELAVAPTGNWKMPKKGLCLEPGGYRITAVIQLTDTPNVVHYRESRLIVVY